MAPVFVANIKSRMALPGTGDQKLPDWKYCGLTNPFRLGYKAVNPRLEAANVICLSPQKPAQRCLIAWPGSLRHLGYGPWPREYKPWDGARNHPRPHGNDMPMADLSLVIRPQTPADLAAIEKLDERAFGPGRFARSAYRLREGIEPDYALSFVARAGTLLIGANRMTPIFCGNRPALLLGPLTVDPPFRSGGIGEELVTKSLDAARAAGHRLVLLVGDMAYYDRMGFTPVPPNRLIFAGPVDPERLLYCELVKGAFEGVKGKVRRSVF